MLNPAESTIEAWPPAALDIRIRTATLRDYEELCALFDSLDAVHREARPELFQEFDGPARSRDEVARLLADRESTILVAAAADGLAGLAVLVTRPASAFAGAVPRRVIELDNLVVRETSRGRRVGRRLLSAAVEWSRQRRATHVEVAVHEFNTEAIRFYAAFGFAPSVKRMMLAV
ncbi:GNAT family N-acetyltransferase [Reyranella sp. CPCC 100927]|uniref:GNAT family N-acetyltransferase n=1 Tax=Reyranella sp. CPCC 100927 TaxID=2599616 RepID=UPI0011B3D9C5|nr:GNAT family N-acetyltransferase [Reyranella sp. CPCC 100927]TWT10817.1 GNAT family N-acetyltransferase [Reyranella sp. CPCC 100927]